MVAAAQALPSRLLPPQKPGQAVEACRPRLWLCTYIPHLALTAAGLDLTQPCGLQETLKGRPSLYAVSETARQAGIEVGMAPAAALALCPSLRILPRDVRLEQLALDILADAALEFSPWVSQDYPNALLLEVGSCLNLFGGAEALREKVRRTMHNAGHRSCIALAPSPSAAELLARVGREAVVQKPSELRSLLGQVPLVAVGWDGDLLKRLARTGVRTLADVWRLPRDGLARRYGIDLLRNLDALAGFDARILRRFHRAPHFASRRELPTELEKLDHFFPAVEQLASELADYLCQRDAAVSALSLSLRHYRRPASRIELSLRRASRDAVHCCRLLREKLERTPLPAPVLAIELSSAAIIPFQPQNLSLFDDEQDREHDWQATLEQLQTRLGHQALQYPVSAADHRPARAGGLGFTPVAADTVLPARPLMLLTKPRPVNPFELHCLSDSERIESGWWDGAAIRRDYRIAYDRAGRKLWVFQDLSPGGGWYCHGLFG